MTMPPEIIVEEIKKAAVSDPRYGRTRQLKRRTGRDTNDCSLARLRRATERTVSNESRLCEVFTRI